LYPHPPDLTAICIRLSGESISNIGDISRARNALTTWRSEAFDGIFDENPAGSGISLAKADLPVLAIPSFSPFLSLSRSAVQL